MGSKLCLAIRTSMKMLPSSFEIPSFLHIGNRSRVLPSLHHVWYFFAKYRASGASYSLLVISLYMRLWAACCFRLAEFHLRSSGPRIAWCGMNRSLMKLCTADVPSLSSPSAPRAHLMAVLFSRIRFWVPLCCWTEWMNMDCLLSAIATAADGTPG